MRAFTSNCTLPPEGTNYVGPPSIRGTLQILWSSLSVLILCAWSTVYLNVPCRTQAKTMKQRFRRARRRLFNKAVTMLFSLLNPAAMVLEAFEHWIAVEQSQTGYERQAESDNVVWSRSHTHFANMGGFGISFQDVIEKGSNTVHGTQSFDWQAWCEATCAAGLDANVDKDEQKGTGRRAFEHSQTSLSKANADDQEWQIDEAISATMASITPDTVKQFLSTRSRNERLRRLFSFWLPHGDGWEYTTNNLLVLKANLWIPDAAQLLKARELGIITSLPNMDIDDLNDRDKSSGLIKVVAIGQTCWFVLQFLVRIGSGQTNTQLEVMVSAFAVFSVAAYILNWDRPKNPTYTIILKAARRPSSGMELLQMAAEGSNEGDRYTIWISNSCTTLVTGKQLDKILIGLDVSWTGLISVWGAFHCIAWNHVFATQVDRILWRVSSLGMVLFLPMYWVLGTACNILEESWKGWKIYAALVCVFLLAALLTLLPVAQLIILVEVFRCLGFQPTTVFETSWLNNIPHLS